MDTFSNQSLIKEEESKHVDSPLSLQRESQELTLLDQFLIDCSADSKTLVKYKDNTVIFTEEQIKRAEDVIRDNKKAEEYYTMDTLFVNREVEYASAVLSLSRHVAPKKEVVYYNTFLMGQALLCRKLAKVVPWTRLSDLERDLKVENQTYGDYVALLSLHPYIGPHCTNIQVSRGYYEHNGIRIGVTRDNWRNDFMNKIGGRRTPPEELVDDIKAMAIAERCLQFNWPMKWVFADFEFISSSKGPIPFLLALYDGECSTTFELTIDREILSTTDVNMFVKRYPQFERYVNRKFDKEHNDKTWITIKRLLAHRTVLLKGGDQDKIIFHKNFVEDVKYVDLGTPEGPLFLSQDKLAQLLPDRFDSKHDPVQDMKAWVKLIRDVQEGLNAVKLPHVDGYCGAQMLFFLKHKYWTMDILTLKIWKKKYPPTGTFLSQFRGSFLHTHFVLLKDFKHVDVFTNGSIVIQKDRGFVDDIEYGAKNQLRATDPVRHKTRKSYVARTETMSTVIDREESRQTRARPAPYRVVTNESVVIYEGELKTEDLLWGGESKSAHNNLDAIGRKYLQKPADIVTFAADEGLYFGTGARQTLCCVFAIMMHIMFHPTYESLEPLSALYFALNMIWGSKNTFIDLEKGVLADLINGAAKEIPGLKEVTNQDGGINKQNFYSFLANRKMSPIGTQGEIVIVDMTTSTGHTFVHAWYLLYRPTFRHPDTRFQPCLIQALQRGGIPGFEYRRFTQSVKTWMTIMRDRSHQAPVDVLPYLSWKYRFNYKLTSKSFGSKEFEQHTERTHTANGKYVYLRLDGSIDNGLGHFEFVRTDYVAQDPATKEEIKMIKQQEDQRIQLIETNTERLHISSNEIPSEELRTTQADKTSTLIAWEHFSPIQHLSKTTNFKSLSILNPALFSNQEEGQCTYVEAVIGLLITCMRACIGYDFYNFCPGLPKGDCGIRIHPSLYEMSSIQDGNEVIFLEWPQTQRTYTMFDGAYTIVQHIRNDREFASLIDTRIGKVQSINRIPIPYECQTHHIADLHFSLDVISRTVVGEHVRVVKARIAAGGLPNNRILSALPASGLNDLVNDLVGSGHHLPLQLPVNQHEAMKLWFHGTNVVKRIVEEPVSMFSDMVQYVEVLVNAKPGSLDTECLRRSYMIMLANMKYDALLISASTSFYSSIHLAIVTLWERYGIKRLVSVPDCVIRGGVDSYCVGLLSVTHWVLGFVFVRSLLSFAWCSLLILWHTNIFDTLGDVFETFYHFTLSYWIYLYGYSLIVPWFLEIWRNGRSWLTDHVLRLRIFIEWASTIGKVLVSGSRLHNMRDFFQQDIADPYPWVMDDNIYGTLSNMIFIAGVSLMGTYIYQTWKHRDVFILGDRKCKLVAMSSRSGVLVPRHVRDTLKTFGIHLEFYNTQSDVITVVIDWPQGTKQFGFDVASGLVLKYLKFVTKPEHEKKIPYLSLHSGLVVRDIPGRPDLVKTLRSLNVNTQFDSMEDMLKCLEGLCPVYGGDEFSGMVLSFAVDLTPNELRAYIITRLEVRQVIRGGFVKMLPAYPNEFGLANCRRDVPLIHQRAVGLQPYVPANPDRVQKLYEIDPYSLHTLRKLKFKVGHQQVGWHEFLNKITQRELPKVPKGDYVKLFDPRWNGVMPVRPDGRIINTLVALFNRHGSPPTLRDPNFISGLREVTHELFADIWKWDGEFYDEMGRHHEPFKYVSKLEYLELVDPRKRASYARGFVNFQKRPRISKTLRAIPKNDESQYKKIHLHTEGLKEAVDSCKQRLIFNPSAELKANCGYVMHNIRKRYKRLPAFRFSAMTGRTPEEIEQIMEFFLTELDKNIKHDDPNDEVVPVVYDGFQNDSTIDGEFIDETDNVWIEKMFDRTCADLGYNVVQTKQLKKACADLEIPFVCALETMKEHSYKRKKQFFNITGVINGSVVSGHSSRTSDGNTSRLIILLRKIGRLAGLVYGYNYMIFQAGDDTKLFMPRSKLNTFMMYLNVYYTQYAADMPQTVHGLGLCYQNLMVVPGKIDFLSKCGFQRPGYKTIMVREPSRVWKTGGYYDSEHLTLSEFNQAITAQMQSWIDPKTTLGFRTILSYREMRNLSKIERNARVDAYNKALQLKTKKNRMGLTILPAYALFSIGSLARLLEAVKQPTAYLLHLVKKL